MSERNMYGCLPCPKCDSKFRVPYRKDGVLRIECDDCGLKQPGEWADDPVFGENGVVNATEEQMTAEDNASKQIENLPASMLKDERVSIPLENLRLMLELAFARGEREATRRWHLEEQ